MADEIEDGPSPVPGIIAGAAVGTGALAATTHFVGKKTFSAENLKHLESLTTDKIGQKIAMGVGESAVQKEVTKGMVDHASNVKGLASEYASAGHMGKMKVGFKGMSTMGKVGVGALVVGAAIGTTMLVNSWREKSHVQRLQEQRAMAMNQQRQI